MKLNYVFRVHQKAKQSNILLVLYPLFFVLLADSTLAYAFPIIVEKSLQSHAEMGLILGCSSITGILIDFFVPKIVKNATWKQFLLAGISLSLLFPLFIYIASISQPFLFFLMASLIWGIYFEFLGFAQQSFVVEEAPKSLFSKDWSLIHFTWQLTTLIGPLLGAFLLSMHIAILSSFLAVVQITALLILYMIIIFTNRNNTHTHKHVESTVQNTISLFKEIHIFSIVGKAIAPVFLTSLAAAMLISLQWSLGGLYGEKLLGTNTGWVMVSFFFNGAIMLGNIILFLNPISHKKKQFAIASAVGGGFALIPLLFFENTVFILISIFVANILLALVVPLTDAAFSEIAERNQVSELYVMSISRMAISFSYIVTPFIVGVFADTVSYGTVYGLFGMVAILLALISLLISPKKIRVPQKKVTKIIDE